MRSGFLLLPVSLIASACSSEPGSAPEAPATAEVAQGAELIDCAVGGRKELSRACAVERIDDDGTLFLTVRHPDGAFRRFKVLEDGRGLEPADGAEGARLRMNGDRLEVAIGSDRYLFPATRASDASNP